MAKKTIVQLVDDIDGNELKDGDGETVSFALDGADYGIDLSNANADKLRGLFMDYVAAGRKVGKSKATKTKPAYNASEVRAWAQDQGLEVPARGRIPANVLDAWNAK